MFCRNCGTELPDGAEFCPQCGTPVEREESASQVEHSSPAPSDSSADESAGAKGSRTFPETPDPPKEEPASVSAVVSPAENKDQKKQKKNQRTRIILISVLAVLVAAGVITGLVVGHNRSKQAVTRYDWIQMLDQQAGISYDSKAKHQQHFSDVAPDNRYYPAVQAAYEAGLLDKDKAFRGDDPATEEFVGVTGMKTIRKYTEGTPSHSSESLTDQQYYELAKQNGIAGNSPGQKVTRAESKKRLKTIKVLKKKSSSNKQAKAVVQIPTEIVSSKYGTLFTYQYDSEAKHLSIKSTSNYENTPYISPKYLYGKEFYNYPLIDFHDTEQLPLILTYLGAYDGPETDSTNLFFLLNPAVENHKITSLSYHYRSQSGDYPHSITDFYGQYLLTEKDGSQVVKSQRIDDGYSYSNNHTYQFDQANRIIQSKGETTCQYSYDSAGKLVQMKWSTDYSQVTFSCSYNSQNQLIQVQKTEKDNGYQYKEEECRFSYAKDGSVKCITLAETAGGTSQDLYLTLDKNGYIQTLKINDDVLQFKYQ